MKGFFKFGHPGNWWLRSSVKSALFWPWKEPVVSWQQRSMVCLCSYWLIQAHSNCFLCGIFCCVTKDVIPKLRTYRGLGYWMLVTPPPFQSEEIWCVEYVLQKGWEKNLMNLLESFIWTSLMCSKLDCVVLKMCIYCVLTEMLMKVSVLKKCFTWSIYKYSAELII